MPIVNTDAESQSPPGEPMEMAMVKVILDRPGVLACGEYRSGVVYEVDAATAKRLIDVKGFRLADEDCT